MKPRSAALIAATAAVALAVLATSRAQEPPSRASVEILRDRWGIAHVFAASDNDGFFGVGYASAEDRLLQMDLFRRRANGRLAEVYGARWVESDRKFRVAGMPQHCRDAAAALPEGYRAYLDAYAQGVNAWVAANPQRVRARMTPLAAAFERWTPADSVCAWMGVAEIFDRLYDEGPVRTYDDFQKLAAQLGEEEALQQSGMMIDDAAAVVPESEMAKLGDLYQLLKNRPPTPGYWKRSTPDHMLRFSHAWAVGGARSETGKPLLASDPQVSVSSPPLWYEFHLSAGRYDVRGIGFAGAPAMLVGFNRAIAWGATALGAGSGVTYIERTTPDGRGYIHQDRALPFSRRTERIAVKDAEPVVVESLRTRHGFVFNSLLANPPRDRAYVSHYSPIERKATSLLGLLGMMGAGNWAQFRDAMQYYYSPGIHIVYADWHGDLAYQTLNWVPLTRRTPRMALEGWTGLDEIAQRIPLDEMPHMLNPSSHVVSHANNLPIGSWYPYDLGIGTGGTGHTTRSLRLHQLLSGERRFTIDSFESEVHRDDISASIAGMFPAARKVAEQTLASDRAVIALLDALKDWDLRYRADQATYPAAMALAAGSLPPYRRSPLSNRLGGGEGGIAHLARLLKDQYGDGSAAPRDPDVRQYLTAWLQAAAAELPRFTTDLAPRGGQSRHVHSMPYQANGPLGLPSLDRRLDLVSPPLNCGAGGTIWSQLGNSYTQLVDLSNTDNSRTLLPPGISEDPESPHHTDQMNLWVEGKTHPAPLTRARVEEIAVSRITLRR
jgi:penicillin G amidase